MLEHLVLGYASTYALAAARIGGFVTISPLPGESAPMQAKLGLVLVLAVLVTPLIVLPGSAPELGFGLILPAAFEVVVGLLIGLAFRLVLSAADVLGGVLSQAIGLGMPSVFNPALGAQDTPLGQLVSFFGLLFALTVGAHRVALSYLCESFRALPVGSSAHVASSVVIFVELAGSAIAVGTRLAMPVIAVSIAIQVVLALVARAAPTMQLFSVGFSVLLLAGFGTLSASLRAIATGLAQHFSLLGGVLEQLLASLLTG